MSLELDTIYCGDCLGLLREIPDKSIDLILTDPPYGIKEAAGANQSPNPKCKSPYWDRERTREMKKELSTGNDGVGAL